MHDPGRQISDAQHVLVGFRGQAQHEIQLHGAVPPGEGRAAGLQQVLLGNVLVDHVPEPLGPGLRGEGQTGFAALGQPLHQAHGEIIRPQTGQREIHVPLLAEGLQLIAQLRQRRIVAGGQAGQGHLLISGVVAGLHAVPGAKLPAAVADGTVDIARLTEAAAPDAAPEQLQHHPVLDDLRGGYNGFCGKEGLVHIPDDALGHHRRSPVPGGDGGHGAVVVIRHIVQAGDVDARQLRGGPKKRLLGPALPPGPAVQLHQLHGDVLPLAQAHQVDEVGDGLGVVHGGAPGDDQRGQGRALRAVNGNVCQVQHIQDGGKGHLIAHGESHDVKIRDGLAGLQGKQGHPRPAHLLLHVAPGGEHPLAPHALHVVHHAVEDPHAQVGHADLIGVREAEGNAGIHLGRVLLHGVVFPAHVAGRLLHPGQDALQSFIHGKFSFMYAFCGGGRTSRPP